ncbi:MAG TPA: large conductance mechanosensitive channel protein MscL, partial [Gammaproteobacteria bacterium]|nr:large conductance mechanosensitive channel protein MscL [Gammaproteobacteria bacterium]
ITFLIIAFAVFMLVRSLNKMQTRFKKPEAPAEATTKSCPQCFTDIPIKATRCPNCTSTLS